MKLDICYSFDFSYNFMILLCQSFHSLFKKVVRFKLLMIQVMYGLEEIGVVMNYWAINIDMNFLISLVNFEILIWDFTLLFYRFQLKSFTNTLQLPLWYVVTLFQLSTNHVCCNIPSNIPGILCCILIF